MSNPGVSEEKTSKAPSKLWVPIVLLLGAIIGVLLYFWSAMNEYYNFGFERFPFQRGFTETFGELHIILSSISVALLVALIIVYGRTYLHTRANFIFGLLVVLFALLLQALLRFPILLGIAEHVPIRPDVSSNIADIFSIIAFTAFLYLSLE